MDKLNPEQIAEKNHMDHMKKIIIKCILLILLSFVMIFVAILGCIITVISSWDIVGLVGGMSLCVMSLYILIIAIKDHRMFRNAKRNRK